MRVKRYLVDTMPEAMLQIRNDLGIDAVILSTKETKIGGFLGMFQQKKIEVIAAVEKEEQPKSVQPKQVAQAIKYPSVPQRAVPSAYKKTADLTASLINGRSETAVTAVEPVSSPVSEVVSQFPMEPKEQQKMQPSFLEKDEHSQTELEINSEANLKAPNQDHGLSDEKLLEEIRQMKLWMAKISRQTLTTTELPEPLQKLQDRLREQEVDQQLIDEWMDSVRESWEESGRTQDEVELSTVLHEKVISFLGNRFGGGIKEDTRIVYVAGPTGVGKTTTIAKLAAEQLFRYHRKVGFITSDTYRISAVEQLRTYASILNVPLEVVQSPGDMQRAIERLNHCDLILMDTAGRNYRNEMLVSELQSLLSPVENSEAYLVLSLTSKIQDMKKITEHFSKYGLDKVIFTKLDETGSYGAIFNLIQEYPLHLSYMANGQNVPDDLLVPNEKTLCSLLLGENQL